jgi:hypothetical protein
VLLSLRKGNREIGNSYRIAFQLQVVFVNSLSGNGVVGRLIRSHGDFFRRDLLKELYEILWGWKRSFVGVLVVGGCGVVDVMVDGGRSRVEGMSEKVRMKLMGGVGRDLVDGRFRID